MPNIRSSKKRMRQSVRRRARNRVQRATLRSAVKQARSVGTGGESADAQRQAERLLDRAARKGLVSKNKAARQKSRLAKSLKPKS